MVDLLREMIQDLRERVAALEARLAQMQPLPPDEEAEPAPKETDL